MKPFENLSFSKLKLIFFISLFVGIFYQNCGKGFEVNENPQLLIGKSNMASSESKSVSIPVYFNNLGQSGDARFTWQIDPLGSNIADSFEQISGEVTTNLTSGQFNVVLIFNNSYVPRSDGYISLKISEVTGKVQNFSQRVDIGSASLVVDGGWSPWTDFGMCSKTCDSGTQSRTRTCNNPAPRNGGTSCMGPSSEQRSCNTQVCTGDGGWSDWSAWSTCSVMCGAGTQTRTRTCTNPPPSNGGMTCSGAPTETQACNTQMCTGGGTLNPINGGWSNWVMSGTCSKSCNSGLQNFTRTCTNPAPANGGATCQGDATKQEICNTQACPVNGVWSDWGAWSACSVSCGTGTQSRTRLCNNPAPSNGGVSCAGSASETQACAMSGCQQVNPTAEGLALTESAVCVKTSKDKVYCKGEIAGSHPNRVVEVQIPGGLKIQKMVSAFGAMCATAEGAVYCWGKRKYPYQSAENLSKGYVTPKPEENWGQLNADKSILIAQKMNFQNSNIVEVEMGPHFMCARSQNGDVGCLGYFPNSVSVAERMYASPQVNYPYSRVAYACYIGLFSQGCPPYYGKRELTLGYSNSVLILGQKLSSISIYGYGFCGISEQTNLKCFGFVPSDANPWNIFNSSLLDRSADFESITSGSTSSLSQQSLAPSSGVEMPGLTGVTNLNSQVAVTDAGVLALFATKSGVVKGPLGSFASALQELHDFECGMFSFDLNFGGDNRCAAVLVNNELNLYSYTRKFDPNTRESTGVDSRESRKISGVKSFAAVEYRTKNALPMCYISNTDKVYCTGNFLAQINFPISGQLILGLGASFFYEMSDRFWVNPLESSCIFGGKLVPHKTAVAAFSTATVPTGTACTKEDRTCENGLLSGSFEFSSCSPKPLDCLFNGVTVAHGSSVTAYESDISNSCPSEPRVCDNGKLSGTYQHSSCEPPNSGGGD